MRSISRRERRLALWSAVVVFAAILYLFIIEPRFLAWRDLLAQRNDAIKSYQKRSLMVENESIIRNRFALLIQSDSKETSGSRDGLDFYALLSKPISGAAFELRDIRPFTPRRTSPGSGKVHGATLLGEGSIEGLEAYLLHLIHLEESLRLENILVNIPRKDAPIQFTITVSRSVGGLS